MVSVGSADLAASAVNGTAVYFLVQGEDGRLQASVLAGLRASHQWRCVPAKLWTPASIKMTIDPGKGGSAPGVQPGPLSQGGNDWQALTFHGTLGRASGKASFGLVVEGGPVSIAAVVAAPIGQEWSRLLLSSRG